MKKFLTTILIGMLLFIFGGTFIITRSLSPYNQARAETIELAGRKADLIDEDQFYWFNGEETFFTITGLDSEGTAIAVIVQQDSGDIQVFNQADILSENEAILEVYNQENPEEIMEARIGVYKDQPVWEVSFRLENGRIGYSMLSLTSGEWIQTIRNI